MSSLLSEYVLTVEKGKIKTICFLKNNHKLIRRRFGNLALQECCLNLRVHFYNNKEKEYKKIQSVINIKKVYHKSDLAILWNYTNKYGVEDMILFY
jgi:hypothetical protein